MSKICKIKINSYKKIEKIKKNYGLIVYNIFVMVKVFQYDENQKEFSSNTYVIGKIGGSCLIVDLGSTSDEIYSYIESHYEKVEAILLTHAHFDHIRGIPAFLKHFKNKNIPIYLAEEDKLLLTSPDKNSSFMTGEKVSVKVDIIPVEDGEQLSFKAGKVKVIKTPFHTEGSVCYLMEDDNCIFTGDTLFKNAIGRYDCETSDSNKISSSLNKLKELSDWLVVYPGHGPKTNIITEKKNNPYMK